MGGRRASADAWLCACVVAPTGPGPCLAPAWERGQLAARQARPLLGRPAAAADVYGHTTLNAPDLV